MRSCIKPYREVIENWNEPGLYISDYGDVILVYEEASEEYAKGVVLYASPSSVFRVGEHDEWDKDQISKYHGEVIIKSE